MTTKNKERVIWRVWGGEIPVKSLVKEDDHSFGVASFYPHGNKSTKGEKFGSIFHPSVYNHIKYKTYKLW